MSPPVLGRDPFARTGRTADPPPPPDPAPPATEPAVPAAESATRRSSSEAQPRRTSKQQAAAPASPDRKRSGRGKSRGQTARAEAPRRIRSATRDAVAGVVREAQGARNLRARRREGAPGRPPLPAWPTALVDDEPDSIDCFGYSPSYLERLRPVLRFLYEEYFRVELRNVEAVPSEGRALLVGNHAGTLPYDGLMLLTGLHGEHPAQRTLRPLIEDNLWHAPFLGMLLARLGGVRADQENAERLLRGDQLVAVFPEGQKGLGKMFSQRYQLQRFGRGGFVKLALRTGSPLIPVAVVGSEEVHPLLGKVTWLVRSLGLPYLPLTPTFPWLGPLGALPLPSKWSIVFGEPIDLSEFGPEAAEDGTLVNQLTEQVRGCIQDLLNEALEKRQSVLFG